MSHQSHLLANDKGDNEVKPGAMHRFPGIYLMAEENPGKSQLGDNLMKAVTSHCLKWGPLRYTDVGRIAQHNRYEEEKEGRKRLGGPKVLVYLHRYNQHI